MMRRTAGCWGPLAFVTAAVVAAGRQPGYSHRTHHVSGLASQGESSAAIMIPGFVALAASHAVGPAPTPTMMRLSRVAAATTLAAGLVRVSDPRCPRPGGDLDVTASDLGHGAASVATFMLWTAMPVVAARDPHVPGWYRQAARLAIGPTIAAFALAGVTTQRGSSIKGAAQRTFLGTVFLFQIASGLAASRQLPSTSPPNSQH